MKVASEAVYTEDSDDGIILKLPQHPAMCGEYNNISDDCIVSVRWASGEENLHQKKKPTHWLNMSALTNAER